MAETLNGTLLKRYNEEKEAALEKLKVAVEALKELSHIECLFVTEGYSPAHPGYYSKTETRTNIAQEALKKIREG